MAVCHVLLVNDTCTLFIRTELIRRMRRYQIANHACVMVKYAKDDRYDKEAVATHDKSVLLSSFTDTQSCIL